MLCRGCGRAQGQEPGAVALEHCGPRRPACGLWPRLVCSTCHSAIANASSAAGTRAPPAPARRASATLSALPECQSVQHRPGRAAPSRPPCTPPPPAPLLPWPAQCPSAAASLLSYGSQPLPSTGTRIAQGLTTACPFSLADVHRLVAKRQCLQWARFWRWVDALVTEWGLASGGTAVHHSPHHRST